MGNYELFIVIGRGEDAHWNRVGTAWSNSDGGIEMCVHGLPLQGRIVMQKKSKQPADKDSPA